jgi:hypothetical protein
VMALSGKNSGFFLLLQLSQHSRRLPVIVVNILLDHVGELLNLLGLVGKHSASRRHCFSTAIKP